jgi:GTPase SAR1 family protein
VGIFVYDSTRKETFDTVRNLYDEFKPENSEKMQFVVIASKVDLVP